MRTATVLSVLLCLSLLAARADEVVLTGGTTLNGTVLAQDDARVRLLLPEGDEVRLLRADVGEVRVDPEAPTPGKYMRYRKPDENGGGLELAVTYLIHPDGGPRIELVSAAHVADRVFFEAVQRILDRADVVLYEGIKPRDATPEQFQDLVANSSNPIGDLQRKLAGWFGLVFQMDVVDYRRPHFVHADLTSEEMLGRELSEEELSGEDGEGRLEGLPESFRNALRQVKSVEPFMDAMLGKPGPFRNQMKAMMAGIMARADLQGMIATMLPGATEMLLTRRNAVVLEKAREQLEQADRSLAVFYGAAHMDGIEKLLVEELGFRRAGGRWLRAWEMGPAPAGSKESDHSDESDK